MFKVLERVGDAEENLVYVKVCEVCAVIHTQDTEWDREKLQARLYDYLKKAGKRTEDSVDEFTAVVEEVASKFYDSAYNGCADRAWLPTTDFSLCIVFAIKAWRANVITQAVLASDYTHVVGQACRVARDCARYHANSWQELKTILKKCVQKKAVQQVIEEAVSTARAIVVKQQPFLAFESPVREQADNFILSWIQTFVELIAKDSTIRNPKLHLSESDAVKLFEEVIQVGNGIPIWLDAGKPAPNCPEITNAIILAYLNYPDPAPPQQKGKSWDKGGSTGCGSWAKGGDSKGSYGADGKGGKGGFGKGCEGGFDMNAMASMAAMMGPMMAMMGGCGGGGGFDGGKGGKGGDGGWHDGVQAIGGFDGGGKGGGFSFDGGGKGKGPY